MRAQGQAPDGESYTSQNTRNANKKMSTSRSYCQREKRCSSLEPVLEHCVLASRFPGCDSNGIPFQQQRCPAGIPTVVPKGTKPLRLLSRLRDGYVKLMNEVASGADFAGVSSFYGAGYGAVCSVEQAGLARSGSKETKSASLSVRQGSGALSISNDFGVPV